jgi:hypothetical protein
VFQRLVLWLCFAAQLLLVHQRLATLLTTQRPQLSLAVRVLEKR